MAGTTWVPAGMDVWDVDWNACSLPSPPMGHRANFVVVDGDGDGWRLHFDRWAGIYMCGLLAGGPAAATRRVAALETRDRATGWYDDAWAEGGAVIDHVSRQLIFFGSDLVLSVNDPILCGYDVMKGIPVKRAFVAL